jgi:hypothetical protein
MTTPVAANVYGVAVGTSSTGPFVPIVTTRAPTSTDIKGPNGPFAIGQQWVNKSSATSYQLVQLSVSNGIQSATWSTNGSATGSLSSLTADDATTATPSSGTITVSGGTTGLTTTASGSTLSLTGTLDVANGGTGATTLTGVLTGNGTSAVTANAVTQHGVIVAGVTNAVASLTVGTNGQVLIGSTGANPAFGTLTSTTGLTFTGGAGSLAINTTGGGLKATSESGAGPFTGATQNSYIFTEAAQTTVSLPATSAIGDFFIVCGTNANSGGWLISQATGQEIFSTTNHSTSGATGSISTGAANTSAFLMCTAANTTWIVLAGTGTITYT